MQFNRIYFSKKLENFQKFGLHYKPWTHIKKNSFMKVGQYKIKSQGNTVFPIKLISCKWFIYNIHSALKFFKSRDYFIHFCFWHSL